MDEPQGEMNEPQGEMDEPQGELPDLDALLKMLREAEPDGETFCLRKITEWLAANGTPRSDYEHYDTPLSRAFYHSGIYLKLSKDLKLSIQTEPSATGKAFCETALVTEHGLIYDSSLGYFGDVCRWDEPEDLFQHIIDIRQKLKDKQAEEKPVDTADGP